MRQLLKDVRPDLAEQWHHVKNAEIGLSLDTMTSANPKKAWWIGKCGHEYFAQVVERAGKSADLGCSYCAGKKILKGFNDLATLKPHLAKEWHPTRNLPLTPENVGVGVRKEAWWICSASHEWKALIYSRGTNGQNGRGNGCPVCASTVIRTGVNDLATVKPYIASQWHPVKNGDLKASEVSVKSNKKVWWKGNCGHEWDAVIASRSVGKGCPICSNKKLSLGENDLESIEPLIAAEWHPIKNGTLLPRDVTTGYSKNVWWLCSNKHEWLARVTKRTQRNQGCPKCSNRVSKLENELFNHVVSLGLDPIQSDREVLFGKELDIYIPSKKVGIEFNGLYFHSEKADKSRGKTATYHYDKWLTAKKAGIELIQVWEDDWRSNKDIILNLIEDKLDLNKQPVIDVTGLSSKVIKEDEAKNFFNRNHLEGFVTSSYYLGLIDDRNNICAAIALNKTNKCLEIKRYATVGNIVGGFIKLLDFANESYKPNNFIGYSDNCLSSEELYKSNGFLLEQEIDSTFMYIVNNKREDKHNYTVERFQSDPKLIYVEGETTEQLAELNGLKRIWDAGKTRWVKYY
jgi:hypothetical protein